MRALPFVCFVLFAVGCGGAETLEALPGSNMEMTPEEPKDVCEGLKLTVGQELGVAAELHLDAVTGTCPEDAGVALIWGSFHSGTYIQAGPGWTMVESSQGDIWDRHAPVILETPFRAITVRIRHDETSSTYEITSIWQGMIEIQRVVKL